MKQQGLLKWISELPLTLKIIAIFSMIAIGWQLLPFWIAFGLGIMIYKSLKSNFRFIAPFPLIAIGVLIQIFWTGNFLTPFDFERYNLSRTTNPTPILINTSITTTPSLPISNGVLASLADKSVFPVTRIIDGASFFVSINEQEVIVKLVGIIVPQYDPNGNETYCYGKDSFNKTQSLLTDKYVRLEADTTIQMEDATTELYRYVTLEDGLDLGELLLSQGFAVVNSNDPQYQNRDKYLRVENGAKEQGLGLWNITTCSGKVAQPSPITTPLDTMGTVCICTENIFDCDSFARQTEAQGCFDVCGGVTNDIHYLDTDRDGLACEMLP